MGPTKKPRASRGGSGAGQIGALRRGGNQRATRRSNAAGAGLFPSARLPGVVFGPFQDQRASNSPSRTAAPPPKGPTGMSAPLR